MRSDHFLIAFFGFLAFVAFMPAVIHYVTTEAATLPIEIQFLASLVVPATVALWLASWLQPSGGV